MNKPSVTLLAGVKELDKAMTPHGFRFEFRGEGRGSGGDFAWGECVRSDRRLEFHFMYSLGLVTYHVADLRIEHTPYLRALGVPPGVQHYPSVSDEPMDAFRDLAHDVAHFCSEFLSGDAGVLRRDAPGEMARIEALSRATIAGYEGDDRKRQEARTHFHAGEYRHVVALLESIRYPDLLAESERHMLALARRRTVV